MIFTETDGRDLYFKAWKTNKSKPTVYRVTQKVSDWVWLTWFGEFAGLVGCYCSYLLPSRLV